MTFGLSDNFLPFFSYCSGMLPDGLQGLIGGWLGILFLSGYGPS